MFDVDCTLQVSNCVFTVYFTAYYLKFTATVTGTSEHMLRSREACPKSPSISQGSESQPATSFTVSPAYSANSILRGLKTHTTCLNEGMPWNFLTFGRIALAAYVVVNGELMTTISLLLKS